MRQGTVVDFKSGKYTIRYDKCGRYGNSTTLTKTQLMKLLLPALPAAEGTARAMEGGAVVADELAIGAADKVVAGEAAPSGAVCLSSPSHFVELRLTSNPVGSRVLSTPTC